MLGSILELLGNVLSLDFSGITDNIVTLVLTAIAALLGIFSVYYLRRRRVTLDHERMAAIIKGLHYAGVTRDVFRKPAPDPRDHQLKGLRWLLAGAGLSGALYTYGSIEPSADAVEAVRGAMVGVVPGAIGFAHLVFAWLCRRRERNESPVGSRMVYRAAARRY
jgi:hypothetical protein